MGDSVRLVKGDQVIEVPSDQTGSYWAQGFRPETDEAQQEREAQARVQERVGGIGGAIRAGTLGALRGVTAGLSDVGLAAIGGDAQAQMENELEQAHPYASTIGQIAGMVAPSLLSGGAAGEIEGLGGPPPATLLDRTPAGFISNIGSKIAESAGGGTAGNIASAAFEGAAGNAGAYISDVALGDRDLSAEGFLGAMGKGALYGGVAGGALSMSSHGLIAARKLFPIADVTPEAVAEAETAARRGIGDSVDTSTRLERAGQDQVANTNREAQQLLADLEAERQAALRQVKAVPETAGPAGETQVQQTSSVTPEQINPEQAPTAEPAPESPQPRPKPGKMGDDAKQLLQKWRAKYGAGAVDYDAASAAARKGRLKAWAEDFEPKTPEDETIKAYFMEPQDPLRTTERVGNISHPPAVTKLANQEAAKASHDAYHAALAEATNVSHSGTELMARATYAARRAAARTLDDVYTAYAAGTPIADIQAAAAKKLTDQLHELAAARTDMIHSLASRSDAGDLMSKLTGTKAAIDQGAKLGEVPKSIGQRILEGVQKPVDPDEIIAGAIGKSKDVNADIADIAPKITRYEAAKAQLTEALGDKAPPDAIAHAQGFRAAQQQAETSTARGTAQAAENIDKSAAGAPAEKLPHGQPVLKGLASKASNLGSAYEALRMMGVPLPDPRGVPVIGPLLSLFLKAKVWSKVAGKFGGSFAATAEGTIAAKAAATQNRINSAVDAMLGGAAKVTSKAAEQAGAMSLAHKLFDDGQKTPYTSEPKAGNLEDMYFARLGELATALSPGAIEKAIRARISTADPTIVDSIVKAELNKAQYLYSLAPKPDSPPFPGQPTRPPSRTEINDWAISVAAAHDPAAVFERVAKGGVPRPAEVDCVKNCYPQLYAKAQLKAVEKLADSKTPLPYTRAVALSKLLSLPIDSGMSPQHAAMLQQGYTAPPPPAPTPQPHPTLSSSIDIGQRTLTRLDRP